ncbi:phenazine biosynthesis protein PhzF family [Gracilibacillus ureilyticus]|uniref:Phenazine biosynthesis protein PhzF family n=1 Tax=Gracilibacillus ureilyticus TaxID=531814 RepID=A0A1H9TWR0_9BACI|nr:PhzF family phenazine biosynthesis isomerase [Gracilibacillus ureilyticus]SES01549.1 phenazine biosynthesis protein PhzF family [Gracilibacillus ureilyticus]
MNRIKVYHYDAFSSIPDKGNPAGVVLNGDELTEDDMQRVAFKVGFNETAFVVKSETADLRIRFFTPGHEMNLCGHATMATVYALKMLGLLGNKETLQIETKAGILPVTIKMSEDGPRITMKQASPKFKPFNGSLKDLARSIGLTENDLDHNLPVVYGSTGTWTLLIPIKKLSSFQKMKPHNKDFPDILKEMPKASVHPFCQETFDAEADMHARHFSSPYSGTVEDAVTGTASGVMGAYYATYIQEISDSIHLTVEQGQEIARDGRVSVKVTRVKNTMDVEITGSAIFVKE